MRLLKRFARRYPMQTFLFLFNAGVFTWLQTTGTMIAHRLGLSGIKKEVSNGNLL